MSPRRAPKSAPKTAAAPVVAPAGAAATNSTTSSSTPVPDEVTVTVTRLWAGSPALGSRLTVARTSFTDSLIDRGFITVNQDGR